MTTITLIATLLGIAAAVGLAIPNRTRQLTMFFSTVIHEIGHIVPIVPLIPLYGIHYNPDASAEISYRPVFYPPIVGRVLLWLCSFTGYAAPPIVGVLMANSIATGDYTLIGTVMGVFTVFAILGIRNLVGLAVVGAFATITAIYLFVPVPFITAFLAAAFATILIGFGLYQFVSGAWLTFIGEETDFTIAGGGSTGVGIVLLVVWSLVFFPTLLSVASPLLT